VGGHDGRDCPQAAGAAGGALAALAAGVVRPAAAGVCFGAAPGTADGAGLPFAAARAAGAVPAADEPAAGGSLRAGWPAAETDGSCLDFHSDWAAVAAGAVNTAAGSAVFAEDGLTQDARALPAEAAGAAGRPGTAAEGYAPAGRDSARGPADRDFAVAAVLAGRQGSARRDGNSAAHADWPEAAPAQCARR